MAGIEDIEKFRQALQNSDNLKGEFKAAMEKMATGQTEPPSEDEEVDWSPVVELAARQGYRFTREELETYVEDIELTQEELELASGGFTVLGEAQVGTIEDDEPTIFNK